MATHRLPLRMRSWRTCAVMKRKLEWPGSISAMMRSISWTRVGASVSSHSQIGYGYGSGMAERCDGEAAGMLEK